MNISKKGIIALALVFAVLIGTVLSAFIAYYPIPTNNVSIAGIGITVNWLGEAETVGALITATEFGLITPPESSIAWKPGAPATFYILFVPDCNGVSETITWTTTLNSTIGTISLQQEVLQYPTTWNWATLAPGFTLTDHQILGVRPPSGAWTEGTKGHIRLILQTLETAPHGDFTFSITFKGDQA